jgi:hypothetical protein
MAIAAILAWTASSTSQTAGAAEDSIDLLPRWKQGEKVRYQMVKRRVRMRDGKVVQQNGGRSDLEVEILEARKDGFVVGWTLGETRIDDPKAAGDPLAKRLLNVYKGFQIVIELDSEASIRGVRNGKELKATADKALKIIMEELERGGLNTAVGTQLKRAVGSMFATQQQVEQVCLREPQMFFLAVGRSYEAGAPIEYDDKLANPLGGDALPSRGRFQLKSLDKRTGQATITWTQAVDKRAATPIIEKTLQQLAERMGKKDAKTVRLDPLSIEDAAEFSVETLSGWPQSVSHTRTATTGATRDQHVLEIKRSNP